LSSVTEQAFYIYRRFVSDHLPIFVDILVDGINWKPGLEQQLRDNQVIPIQVKANNMQVIELLWLDSYPVTKSFSGIYSGCGLMIGQITNCQQDQSGTNFQVTVSTEDEITWIFNNIQSAWTNGNSCCAIGEDMRPPNIFDRTRYIVDSTERGAVYLDKKTVLVVGTVKSKLETKFIVMDDLNEWIIPIEDDESSPDVGNDVLAVVKL